MIPLKTGPYLALDASSSGDSYFVKIKLKSICNVPAVCCSQGWARRGPGPGPNTASGTQKWMVASGMGRMFSAGCEVRNTPWTIGGSVFVRGERLRGWASLGNSKSKPSLLGTPNHSTP